MTQKEIVKKAYEVYPIKSQQCCNPDGTEYIDEDILSGKREAYIKGLIEQLDCHRIKGWVARDKNGRLWLYSEKPVRRQIGKEHEWFGMGFFELKRDYFPNLKWKDEPREVELLVREVK